MKDENFKYQMIAIQALNKKYGFCPSPQQVKLLESDGEGSYILFRIGEHEYRCDNGMILNIEDGKKSEETLSQYFHMFMKASEEKDLVEVRNRILVDEIRELKKQLEEHEEAWATLRRMIK